MRRPKSVDYAVAGALAKAAHLARSHGRFAIGSEAKTLAEFIASEIERLDDPLIGWEENEAKEHRRASKRERQGGQDG